jgi:hypothetical protein
MAKQLVTGAIETGVAVLLQSVAFHIFSLLAARYPDQVTATRLIAICRGTNAAPSATAEDKLDALRRTFDLLTSMASTDGCAADHRAIIRFAHSILSDNGKDAARSWLVLHPRAACCLQRWDPLPILGGSSQAVPEPRHWTSTLPIAMSYVQVVVCAACVSGLLGSQARGVFSRELAAFMLL